MLRAAWQAQCRGLRSAKYRKGSCWLDEGGSVMNLPIPLIADWSSIIGSIITLGTLIFTLGVRSRVKKLREDYYLIQRMPQLAKKLKDCKSALFRLRTEQIQSSDVREAVWTEIERSLTLLRSIKTHMPSLAREITTAIRLVRPLMGKTKYPGSRDEIHSFYLKLDNIYAQIELKITDRRKAPIQ